MPKTNLNREEAIDLLRKHNKEAFHIRHALTVEAVMKNLAEKLGEDDSDFWAMAGLLHDIDYEEYPEEHCKKAPEILEEAGF